MTIIQILLECLGVYTAARVIQMLFRAWKHGAHSCWIISEGFTPRMGLPSWTNIPWITYGNNHAFRMKYSEFQRAGKDAYLQVSATKPHFTVFIADPQAIKEVALQRTRFLKPVEVYEQAVGQFGPHLVSAEGEAWKRQRKVNQKAFTEKNVQLVWSETTTVMNELFDMWDQQGGQEIRVSQMTDVTEKLALMAISSAAFGRRLSWDQDGAVLKGYNMSFERALTIVSASPLIRAIVPTWADGLTKKWQTMGMAYTDLMKYMRAMIQERRTEGKQLMNAKESDDMFSTTDNLFDILLAASDAEGPKGGLSEEELTGNTFIFLLAGHETTAHALGFALVLLALYPEVQEGVYVHIHGVIGDRKAINYSELNEMKLVTGVFLESLRLYPVITQLHKVAQENTVLSIARSGDEHAREDFFIPAGSAVFLSALGLHYNPKYWPEPERFRPSRFTEEYNKDAFLAFSAGHRSCIGRRFAETEATVILALLLARYEVSIDHERFPNVAEESAQVRQARLLNPSHFSTIAPANLPLVFKRR